MTLAKALEIACRDIAFLRQAQVGHEQERDEALGTLRKYAAQFVAANPENTVALAVLAANSKENPMADPCVRLVLNGERIHLPWFAWLSLVEGAAAECDALPTSSRKADGPTPG